MVLRCNFAAFRCSEAAVASVLPRRDRDGHLIGWQATIRRKGYPVQVRTFRNRRDAQAWARQIESEVERGVFVSRAEAESTTLAEALERYAAEYAPRLRSELAIVAQCRRLTHYPIAQMHLAAIRMKDVADFRDARMAEGVAANTVRLDLALLSRLFHVAASEWGMEALRNPCRLVQRPKLPPGRDRRLVGDEEQRLLAACDDARTPWLKPAVILALETAMRQGELLLLRWEHVDLTKRTAHLPETKNGTARDVPLSSRAAAVLKTLPRSIDGKVLATTREGLRQAWERACKRAGITGLRFHDLRHEAASSLAERGLHPLELAAVTGHKSMQMLKRYTHLRAEDLAAKLDRLA